MVDSIEWSGINRPLPQNLAIISFRGMRVGVESLLIWRLEPREVRRQYVYLGIGHRCRSARPPARDPPAWLRRGGTALDPSCGGAGGRDPAQSRREPTELHLLLGCAGGAKRDQRRSLGEKEHTRSPAA